MKKYFLLGSSLYFFQKEINEKTQKKSWKKRKNGNDSWNRKASRKSSASNSVIFPDVHAAHFGRLFPIGILLWRKMKLKISAGKWFPWGKYLPDIFLLSAFNSHDRQNKILHSPCYIKLNFQKIIRTLSWVRFSLNHQKRFWDSWGQEIFHISAQIFKFFQRRWCIDMDILDSIRKW